MKKSIFSLIALIAIGSVAAGCSDSKYKATGTGPMVTVSGTALDIDTAAPAPAGLKVYLFGDEAKYSTTTTDGGAFTIDVPSGSKYQFVTDDADGAASDDYIPFPTFELSRLTIDAAASDVIIHVCRNTKGTEKGTVAAVNNYLANATENAGIFKATSVATSRSVAIVFIQANGGVFGLTPDMSVAVDNPNCQIGYTTEDHFFDANLIPDPTLGPNAFTPATTTKTNGSGTLYIFCDSGDSVKLTITDADTGRNLNFGGPYDVPLIESGMTVIIPGSIDGAAPKNIIEVFTAGGLI